MFEPCGFKARRLFWPVLLASIVLTVVEAEAHPFATVVSFGDSLSDTTNNPAQGDYWQGRWSNGPLWDECLASNLNAALYDYAYAGSETADLSNQVSAALLTGWNATNTLFTVWSGANDFIDNAESNGLSVTAWEGTISRGVGNIAAAVGALGDAGARYVLVMDLPDLSQLPAVRTNTEFAADASTIQTLASDFDTQLSAALTDVARENPSLRLALVDDFTLLDDMVARPASYGFTVVTNDAIDALGDPAFDGPGADYLFWDVIHPTTKAHALLAELAASRLVFAPSILTQPASQTVASGASVTLAVEAMDAEAFQWYFKGRAIRGATGASLTLARATAANAGAYYVNVIGTGRTLASATARLTVKAPPRMVSQPRSEKGIAGRKAVFSAAASGAGPLSYQWQFDGAPIAGATREFLVLTHLQTGAAGSYAVVVTNVVGAATSRVATLEVIVPPEIVSQPASVEAAVGTSVTFTAQATGTGPLHYHWARNGVALPGQTNATYTISAVRRGQAGRYRVLVRNAGGAAWSAAAALTVEPGP